MNYSENRFIERNEIKINIRISFYEKEGQENSCLTIKSEILEDNFCFEKFINQEEFNNILNKYFKFLDIIYLIQSKKSDLYKEDLIKNNFTKNEYKVLVKYLVDSIKNSEDWIEHINDNGNC